MAHSQLKVRNSRLVINYLDPKRKTIEDFLCIGIEKCIHTCTTFTYLSLCIHTYSIYIKCLYKLTTKRSPDCVAMC